MIQLDAHLGTPIFEQLLNQLRFQIASGRYKAQDRLPSTRALGLQLGISFHTVRKAYQVLEEEGYVKGRMGSGFVVLARKQGDKAAQMEEGATLMQQCLQQMLGLALPEDEIRFIFEEQLEELTMAHDVPKTVFIAPYEELATLGAAQLEKWLHQKVEALPFNHLKQAKDAAFILTPFASLRAVRERFPQHEVYGVAVHFNPDLLQEIAALLPSASLGVVSLYPDAIAYLLTALKQETGFSGSMLGVSLAQGQTDLNHVLETADLVAYTPACRRRLHTLLQGRRAMMIQPQITQESGLMVLAQLPH